MLIDINQGFRNCSAKRFAKPGCSILCTISTLKAAFQGMEKKHCYIRPVLSCISVVGFAWDRTSLFSRFLLLWYKLQARKLFLLRSRLLRSSFGKLATKKKQQAQMSAEGSEPHRLRTIGYNDLWHLIIYRYQPATLSDQLLNSPKASSSKCIGFLVECTLNLSKPSP